jgi:hypothetical protein
VTEATRLSLDGIVELSAAASDSALVGYWNELSPALVEWWWRLRDDGFTESDLPVDPLRDSAGLDARGVLDRLAGRAEGDLVITVSPSSPGALWAERFRSELPLAVDVVREVRRDPRYGSAGRQALHGSPYVVQAFRRLSPGRQPPT